MSQPLSVSASTHSNIIAVASQTPSASATASLIASTVPTSIAAPAMPSSSGDVLVLSSGLKRVLVPVPASYAVSSRLLLQMSRDL